MGRSRDQLVADVFPGVLLQRRNVDFVIEVTDVTDNLLGLSSSTYVRA